MAGLTVATVAVPRPWPMPHWLVCRRNMACTPPIVMTAIGPCSIRPNSDQRTDQRHLDRHLRVPCGNRQRRQSQRPLILIAPLVGLVQLAIALLRLGDLSRFISHSVIVGFTLGAGVLIVLGQCENLLGLARVGKAEDHFLVRMWQTLAHYPETNFYTLALGVATVLISLALCLDQCPAALAAA